MDDQKKTNYLLLHRKILQWGWYSDINTTRLFIHCLLRANYTAGEWHGIKYGVGEFITSLPTLSKETGLSIQQARTALSHLKLTGEVTDRTYAKYRIISINNWNEYQVTNRVTNRKSTGNQQATNRELTSDKEINKEINKEEYIYTDKTNLENFKHLIQNSSDEYVAYIMSDPNVYEMIERWMRYKDEKKPKSQNHYEETGLNTFLRKVVRACRQYGVSEFLRVTEDAISSNYMGIVWDRLSKKTDSKPAKPQNKFENGMIKREHDFSDLERLAFGDGD